MLPSLRRAVFLGLAPCLALLAFSGCSSMDSISLPRQQAWFEGRVVDYVTTDISDPKMAAGLGVNLATRLRSTLDLGASNVHSANHGSALAPVYKFSKGEQLSIFPTAPNSIDYTPLWRLHLVRWLPGKKIRPLRSEEDLLSAQDAGDVEISATDIVVNCPIITSKPSS